MLLLPLLAIGVLANQYVLAIEKLRPDDVLVGDLMLTREQADSLLLRKGAFKRDLWRGTVVPYHIRTSGRGALDASYVTLIREAIAHWENHTCLTFEEHTTPPTTGSYIKFIKSFGCWSYVGRQATNGQGQPVSIGLGCNYLGTIIHEIGHALGFQHEQTRPDRDQHVTIHTENIMAGMEVNFEPAASDSRGVPYDVYSIMHYGAKAFSKNDKATIIPKDILAFHLMGQREVGLTIYDRTLANRMYNCDGADSHCPNKPCLNDGVCSTSGSGYQCQCPTGYEGTHCEKPECKDVRRERTCKSWAKRGYCERTHYMHERMKKDCYKSCGFCDKSVCEVESGICQNGGTCSVRGDSFQCTCVNGLGGPVCASRPKRCDGKVCANAGYLDKSCNCECAPGTTGDLCETIIQDYVGARSDQVIPYKVTHGGTFSRNKFVYRSWPNYYLMKLHIKPESGGAGKCAKATFIKHTNEDCEKGFASIEIGGQRTRYCGDNLLPAEITSPNSEMKIIYVWSNNRLPFRIQTEVVDC